jgi:dTDP-L-rhamnose 4-epimerase
LRILITGGAGFIGSHLSKALLRQGHEVRVLDNLEPRVHGPDPAPKSLPKEVEFFRGDVRDKNEWVRALHGIEVVFHLAAYQDYMPDYSKFFHTNVVGTALLYEVIREMRLPVQKVIVASSQAVYGEGQYECERHGFQMPPARSQTQLMRQQWELQCASCGAVLQPVPLSEEFAHPFNQYALSKYAQELTSLRLGRLIGVPSVALRYSITQGAGQSPFNSYSGICRIFTQRLLSDLPPLVFEDGHQKRDYIHINDVIDANLTVMNDSRADFEAFNVGSGVATTVLEYACTLAEVLGKDLRPSVPGKYRLGDNRHSVSNISKLQGLGWKPTFSLRDIMQDYARWITENGLLTSRFLEAEREMETSGVVRSSM